MNKLDIKFKLYCECNSRETFDLDNLKDKQALRDMFDLIQRITGFLYDNSIDELSREWDFPRYVKFTFTNIELSFRCDPKLDEFRIYDTARLIRKHSNCDSRYLSRIIVNGYEFHDNLDAFDFSVYLIDTNFKVLPGFDITRFQSAWADEQQRARKIIEQEQ